MHKTIIKYLFLLVVISTAKAVLLDDFQGYGIGNVREIASPPWEAINNTNFADILAGPDGAYITWGWESAPRGAALLLDAPIANDTSVSSLYFNVYAESENVNHSIGLSDKSSGFSSFDDYEVQIVIKDNGHTDGVVNICVGNGDQIDIAGNMNVRQWYNIWVVVNQVSDKYDLYMTAENDASPENLLAQAVSFRNGTSEDLKSLFLWSYNKPQQVRVGKIALTKGFDLTTPRQAEELINGHFEDGDCGYLENGVPGWRYWGGKTGYHHEESEACFGSKGMKLWWENSGMWQNFNASPGISYECSVNVMDWSGETSSVNWDFRFDIEFYNSNDKLLTKEVVGYFDSTNELDNIWRKLSGAVSAPDETEYGRVVLRLYNNREGIDGTIYIDNVSVISASQSVSPDYNKDFKVNMKDQSLISQSWQVRNTRQDLNNDNVVDIADLNIFTASWLEKKLPVCTETIIIDPGETYQEIEGFGASLTDSSAWLLYKFLTPSERKKVLIDLFDPEAGIGLSYLRQPMGASDFRLNDYTYDDLPDGVESDYNLDFFSIAYDENYIIPTILEILAINPDVRLMASPWTPPTWMKDSGQFSYGNLKSDVYDTYANYFVRFIQAYAGHGICFDAITPQNEPGHEGGGYAGLEMSPAEQIKLINKIGIAFANNNIAAKIINFDFNWDNPNFPLAVLADQQARSYISGTAFHHYSGNVSAQAIVHDAYPDKDIYFTEGSDSVKRDNGFSADLIRNGNFIIDTIRNWSKTVIKWNLALDENNGPKIAGGCDTCYGVITIDQTNRTVTPRPQYYALGHLSKFLRPGAVRIKSTDGDIRTVAFKNTDGSMVLFMINSFSFSETVKLKYQSHVAACNIPAKSIMTLRWGNDPVTEIDIYLSSGDRTALLKRCD